MPAMTRQKTKMKKSAFKTLTALVGGAAMMVIAGPAMAAPALSDAITFVQVDWNGVKTGTGGGGGVSEFKILDYAGGVSELLGATDTNIYATCIEQDQYLRTDNGGVQWFAVYTGISGMPSASGNITSDEEDVIRSILGSKFGEDFTDPDNPTARDSKDVKALQSILWEAGILAGDDLADDEIGTKADNAWGSDASIEAIAEGWLKEDLSGAAFVSLFALLSVDLYGNLEDLLDPTKTVDEVFRLSEEVPHSNWGQDFVTYLPGGSDIPLPVPAPILLMGLGLLGLGWTSRRRR